MPEGPPHLLPPAETEQPDDFILERSGTVIACIIGAIAIVVTAFLIYLGRDDDGRAPTGTGSRATHGAAYASPPKASILHAVRP